VSGHANTGRLTIVSTVGKSLYEIFDQFTVVNDDGCWIWQGARTSAGYGNLYWAGKQRLAHVVSYEFFVGSIPEGLQIDHVAEWGCKSRLCVNAFDHLEIVTHAENLRRGKKLVKTCPRGHLYDEQNTYLSPQGWRGCRKCRSAQARDCHRRKGAAA
jgi:hypothetical protein